MHSVAAAKSETSIALTKAAEEQKKLTSDVYATVQTLAQSLQGLSQDRDETRESIAMQKAKSENMSRDIEALETRLRKELDDLDFKLSSIPAQVTSAPTEGGAKLVVSVPTTERTDRKIADLGERLSKKIEDIRTGCETAVARLASQIRELSRVPPKPAQEICEKLNVTHSANLRISGERSTIVPVAASVPAERQLNEGTISVPGPRSEIGQDSLVSSSNNNNSKLRPEMGSRPNEMAVSQTPVPVAQKPVGSEGKTREPAATVIPSAIIDAETSSKPKMKKDKSANPVHGKLAEKGREPEPEADQDMTRIGEDYAKELAAIPAAESAVVGDKASSKVLQQTQQPRTVEEKRGMQNSSSVEESAGENRSVSSVSKPQTPLPPASRQQQRDRDQPPQPKEGALEPESEPLGSSPGSPLRPKEPVISATAHVRDGPEEKKATVDKRFKETSTRYCVKRNSNEQHEVQAGTQQHLQAPAGS